MNKLITIAVCLGAGVLSGCSPVTHIPELVPLTSSSPEASAKKPACVERSVVERRVKKILIEQLKIAPEQVIATAHFIDDLGADSLDLVELIMAFEEDFGVEISDEQAEKIVTVGDAFDYLEKNATR